MGKNGEKHTPASKTRHSFYYFILFFDKNVMPYIYPKIHTTIFLNKIQSVLNY